MLIINNNLNFAVAVLSERVFIVNCCNRSLVVQIKYIIVTLGELLRVGILYAPQKPKGVKQIELLTKELLEWGIQLAWKQSKGYVRAFC